VAKYALLIGCSSYKSTDFPSLRSPSNDVKRLQVIFENPKIGDFLHVQTSIDLDRQAISIEIEDLFSNKNRDDLLLLYFSGHGIRDENGNLYLATCDAEINSNRGVTKSKSISATFIQDLMNSSRSRRQIVILDCCFSGAFADGLFAKDHGTININSQLGGEGRVILASSSAVQLSFENKNLDTSIYTNILIEGIETSDADIDKDGWISISELHDYAKQKLCEVNPSMKPEIYSIREGFKILLAKAQGRYEKLVNKDFNDAPKLSNFYGRENELSILQKYILQYECQLVMLLGMGGIGKTDLAVKICENVQDNFDYVFWGSLLNAPPFPEFMDRVLKFLSGAQKDNFPDTSDHKIDILISYLSEKRCLIILDNIESVLAQNLQNASISQSESYQTLFESLAIKAHKSCVILTSREKPDSIEKADGKSKKIFCLDINGLDKSCSKEVVENFGNFFATPENWEKLLAFYRGNPLALEIVAKHINYIFLGNISAFLEDGNPIFGDITLLLDQHFSKLSNLEREIMYWLAINREPTSIVVLKDDLLSAGSKTKLTETLQSLGKKIPLERTTSGFTLQPVLMEYMTNRLIKLLSEEIEKEEIFAFNTYSVLKAKSKDYIREIQLRLIAFPIISYFNSDYIIRKHLNTILSKLHSYDYAQPGYAAGNAINLLSCFDTCFDGYNFSRMTIWQAVLQNLSLRNVDLSHSDLTSSTFSEVLARVFSVDLSPDGMLIAIGEDGGMIRLWRLSDCKLICTLEGHSSWVVSIRFSPDSKKLVSASGDQTIRVWDVKAQYSLRILTGHASRIQSVAFSPDGLTIASGSEDKSIRLWQVESGDCFKILQGHTDMVRAVAFSPDGLTIASGSEDKSIRLWQVETGDCFKILQGHQSRVRSIAFSSDSQRLLSGGDDKKLMLWDLSSQSCLNILHGHSDVIRSVAFDLESQILVSGSEDQSIKIWDSETGSCLRTISGKTDWSWSVSFGVNDSYLTTGNEDGTVKIWNVNDKQCETVLKGHSSRVQSAVFNQVGNLIASGSDDCTIRVWDFYSKTCIKILKAHDDIVRSVKFSDDDKLLASCSDDRTIRIWKVNSDECLRTLQGHTNAVRSIAFSPNNQILASAGEDLTIRVWDIVTGDCLKVIQAHEHWILSIAFSPDGKYILSGSEDKYLKLWNVVSGNCESKVEAGNRSVLDVAFSPIENVVASGCDDTIIRLWNIKTGYLLKELVGHTGRIRSVSFSHCGNILASSSKDETIKVWDVEQETCLVTFNGYKPYENMNISEIVGLTNAQKKTLKILGAIE
jgi:WD40 repeat protein/AAA+ ATPase superfamily predicted ATPase